MILVVFGTTGELIKLAPVLVRLDALGHRYVLLSLNGTGNQANYHLRVDFGAPGGGSASYEISDDNPGWRVVRIDLWHPQWTSGSFGAT